MERTISDLHEPRTQCYIHHRIADQVISRSVDIGSTIKSLHGLLSQIGKDQSTELFDLYVPLFNQIKNKDEVWLGLNLIFPSKTDLVLPIVGSIKCYVLTFHGDPIDNAWINSSVERLLKHKGKSFLNNLIICCNGERPDNLISDIKYHRIEHLHLLPRFYGQPQNHLARKAEVRNHKFSFLSHREIWFRTALFMCIYEMGGIYSFTQKPDFSDEQLLDFLKHNGLSHKINDVLDRLPLPLDNYYEDSINLNDAWSVNNIAYQDCLVNVVNESTIPFKGHMSEKTFKPFISKTLPIFNSINQINRLREFGFAINDSIYNDISDPILFQVNALKKLIDIPKKQLIDLVNEHSQHNRDWFFKGFNEEVNKLNSVAMSNLIQDVKNIVD